MRIQGSSTAPSTDAANPSHSAPATASLASEPAAREPSDGSGAHAGASLARAMWEESRHKASWLSTREAPGRDQYVSFETPELVRATPRAHVTRVERAVLSEVSRAFELSGKTLEAAVGRFLQAKYAELSKLDRSSPAEVAKKLSEKLLGALGSKVLTGLAPYGEKLGEKVGTLVAKVFEPVVDRLLAELHRTTRATLGMTQQMLSVGGAIGRLNPKEQPAVRDLITELAIATEHSPDWHQTVVAQVRTAFAPPATREVLAALCLGHLELKYKENPFAFVDKHGPQLYAGSVEPAAVRRADAFEAADQILH